MTGVSHIEALTLAHTEFAQRLAQVRQEHWHCITPCADWDVGELIRHVVAGYDGYLRRLDGLPSSELGAVLDAYQLPDTGLLNDIERAFYELGDEFENRYGDPRTLKLQIDHFGQTISGDYLLALRIFDMVIHSWDLAIALGVDATLDTKLVDLLWAEWAPRADEAAGMGVLGGGPSGALSAEASTQDRLLDLTGRRP